MLLNRANLPGMDQLLTIAAVAAIEALIGGAIGMVLWVAVQRRIERRDKEMDDLRTGNETLAEDLRRLREEQLRQLIDNIGEKHDQFERRFAGQNAKLNSIDDRIRDECVHRRELGILDDRLTGLEKGVTALASSATGTKVLVELIAGHMNITLPGKAT